MPQIQGLSKLKTFLGKKRRDAVAAGETVVVGFSQRYAMVVHEDMNAAHPTGQAKYLEQPARDLQSELALIITQVFIKTKSMRQALIMAGLRLQREAQELVPIDTSALRASAYTAAEEDADAAASTAFAASESIRLGEEV